MQQDRHRLSPALAAVAAALVLVLGGCRATQPGSVASPEPTPNTPPATLLVLKTRPHRVPGYDRSCSPGSGCVFGPAWSDDVSVEAGHNGCDTRNDILRRDLTQLVTDPKTKGCVVVSGILRDPYSGSDVPYNRGTASTVAIDHIIPLSAAWDRGAAGWTPQKRRDFANDPVNLLATTLAMNSSKGDSMPDEWMPPTGGCTYGARIVTVALKYEIPLTVGDLRAIDQCVP